MTRQSFTLDQIKDMLLGQIDSVVDHFAPPVAGSYTDKGLYYTLNPGRGDRRVGSFVITMTGAKAGKWTDYATGSHGDILDLCGLAINGDGRTDVATSLREARAFLGLDTSDPAAARRREERAAQSRAQRAEATKQDRDRRERRRAAAHRLWLSGAAELSGTPVDLYLRARGIPLDRLPRAPRVLRSVARCRYEHTDRETGEVFEGEYPVMAAAVTDATGRFQGIHRTYLHCHDGKWTKAPLPAAKKVLGNAWEHGINVWAGIGPRGGKPASLPQCAPGSHVYLTEGIEDALSVALLLPAERVVAAISLGNLRAIRLPANVAGVTIVADLDEGAQQRDLLDRAIEAHRASGRIVRLWQNGHGGKDLNDALRAALSRQGGKGAA